MFDFPITYIPEALRELIDAELIDDETIQWIDLPIPTFFSSATMATFFFAIPWTAFALFWMCGATGVLEMKDGTINFGNINPGRLLFAAFGIPFVLIGLPALHPSARFPAVMIEKDHPPCLAACAPLQYIGTVVIVADSCCFRFL